MLTKNILQEVKLIGVKTFAYHGFYPEEQLIGGYFTVDLSTQFYSNGPELDTENLQHTVNYEVLNCIILTRMRKTQRLLESLAHQIINDTLESFPFLIKVRVKIKKLHPPMGNEIEYAEVVQYWEKQV